MDSAIEKVDVAIIGGGPAGAAAALTILMHSSLRVALIEASRYESFRIGECLGPGVVDLLRYFSADHLLASEAHLPAHGIVAAWGSADPQSQDFLLTGRGQGWHVDRRQFDQELASLVQQRGGTLLLGCKIEAATRNNEGSWNLLLRSSDSRDPIAIDARFIIDASGRRASFARSQSAELQAHDKLIAISGELGPCQDLDDIGFALIEAMASGWWYSVRLRYRRTLVVWMTDSDIARRESYLDAEVWQKLMHSSAETSKRVRGAKLLGELRLHAAYSGIRDPLCGRGWIAAGDAAVSFDPLASMGIGYALLSGIEAARAAHNVLTGSGRLVSAYEENVQTHFSRYLALRNNYYAFEQRWHDQPFWLRRHSRPKATKRKTISA